VPMVPQLVRLHTGFEVDPLEASQTDAPDIAVPAGDGEGQEPWVPGEMEAAASGGEPDTAAEGPAADVLRAVDDAVRARLEAFDARLKLPG